MYYINECYQTGIMMIICMFFGIFVSIVNYNNDGIGSFKSTNPFLEIVVFSFICVWCLVNIEPHLKITSGERYTVNSTIEDIKIKKKHIFFDRGGLKEVAYIVTNHGQKFLVANESMEYEMLKENSTSEISRTGKIEYVKTFQGKILLNFEPT